MRWFSQFVFVGVILSTNVTSLKVQQYPSNLAWSFGLNNEVNENNEGTRTVCQTEECKKIAKVMLESMDKSVDPCDDFYEYACGKWGEHNPRPEGKKIWSSFRMLQENVKRQVEDIFKEGIKDNDLLAVKLAKKWHATCIDTDAMDKQGLEPLVSTVSRIGGWPMIMDPDEWNEEEYNWQKVDDQYMRLTGQNAFHDVRVYSYGYNDTGAIVYIDIPHLPPGFYELWIGGMYNSDEVNESDEDPSDEEKHSDEHKDSQEPGSEGEDDSDGDNSSDTNEPHNDQKTKKNKSIDKSSHNHRKNKKSVYSGRRRGITIVDKHKKSNIGKKLKIKKREIPTKVHNKRAQRFTHRGKLNGRKRAKKTFDTVYKSTTPRFTTEQTNDNYQIMIRQQYTDYISKVAQAIAKERGMEVSEEHINKDVEDMIEFQLQLSEIVVELGTELELTLDGLQDWYDEKQPKTDHNKIDWVYKIAALFDEANVAVDGSLDVVLGPPDYFEALVSLLKETPSRTIVNYIHWNFLSRMIQTTTNEMRELYNTWEEVVDEEKESRLKRLLEGNSINSIANIFEKSLQSINEREITHKKRKTRILLLTTLQHIRRLSQSVRSSECMWQRDMRDILAYEYVRKHFSDKTAKTAMDMIDDIQKEVEYLIKESEWMDEDTRDFVLAKLVNMDKLVGYPEWYKNSTIVKRYFQGLIIGKSYYENRLSYIRYRKWNNLRMLTQEDEDVDIWWISPITLNALFNPRGNSITLTAADFQSPLFAYNRPQVINFGIIGVIMAHEVNHGFDDYGHLYDKNGDVMEWLSVAAEAYNKRAECFVEQFNNYPIDKVTNEKLKDYGNQTVGENMADTMGLQAVFRAYQRRERECDKPDAVLPGLEDLTNDQLFFLSFGNLWCESSDPKAIRQRAQVDPHSTRPLRVIGSVSNSEDFAKAYNCPVGSPMNPEKKCNIWK